LKIVRARGGSERAVFEFVKTMKARHAPGADECKKRKRKKKTTSCNLFLNILFIDFLCNI